MSTAYALPMLIGIVIIGAIVALGSRLFSFLGNLIKAIISIAIVVAVIVGVLYFLQHGTDSLSIVSHLPFFSNPCQPPTPTGNGTLYTPIIGYNGNVAQKHRFNDSMMLQVAYDCPSFPKDSSTLKHIFRDAPGHFTDDTPANRQAIEDTVSDQNNYKGTDKYGSQWYARILSNGKQVWAWVRNNVIRDAGINDTPRNHWDPNRGIIP